MNPDPSTTPRLIDGSDAAPATVLLAHGAGAPMDSPFMAAIASGLAEMGWRVVRFEFPYMVRQRILDRRQAPDRMPGCKRRSARRCTWKRPSNRADRSSSAASRWADGLQACWLMSWLKAMA